MRHPRYYYWVDSVIRAGLNDIGENRTILALLNSWIIPKVSLFRYFSVSDMGFQANAKMDKRKSKL